MTPVYPQLGCNLRLDNHLIPPGGQNEVAHIRLVFMNTIQGSQLSEEKWPPEAAAEQKLGDRLTSSPTIPYVVLASLSCFHLTTPT